MHSYDIEENKNKKFVSIVQSKESSIKFGGLLPLFLVQLKTINYETTICKALLYHTEYDTKDLQLVHYADFT